MRPCCTFSVNKLQRMLTIKTRFDNTTTFNALFKMVSLKYEGANGK